MAKLAVFARLNMMKMRKLHKIRQKMSFLPGYRLVFVVSLCDFFNPGAVCFHCPVAVHADIKAGQRGMPAGLHSRMAIAAVYFVFPRVKLVRKGDSLIRLITFVIKPADFIVCQKMEKQKNKSQKKPSQNSSCYFFLLA